MGIKILIKNKKARFNYNIIDTIEAGMVLTGSEVKSLRAGNCQLKDSYVDLRKGEMFLVNAHISEYFASSYNNHEPERPRKLLLHKLEIERLGRQIKEKGITIVPVSIYLKNGKIKVELGLGKGKKSHDKRESIKARDVKRDIEKRIRR